MLHQEFESPEVLQNITKCFNLKTKKNGQTSFRLFAHCGNHIY
jgi:hypothetical protein